MCISFLRNSTFFIYTRKTIVIRGKRKKTSAVEQKWPNDWTVKKVLDRCSSFLFEQKIDPSFQDYYYYSFWMLKIIQKTKQRNGRAHIPKRSNWNLVKKVVLWIEAGQYPKCWLESLSLNWKKNHFDFRTFGIFDDSKNTKTLFQAHFINSIHRNKK